MEENIQLFSDIMSTEEQKRKSAEEKLFSFKSQPMNTSIQVFLDGMNHHNDNISNLAALLLKKTYIDDKEYFSKHSPQDQNNLSQVILAQVKFERSQKFLQKLADILAKIFYYQKNLSSVFPMIIQWFSSPDANAREFSIYFVEVLCEIGAIEDSVIESSINDFTAMFNQGDYLLIKD
jgi:hypothetical protein